MLEVQEAGKESYVAVEVTPVAVAGSEVTTEVTAFWRRNRCSRCPGGNG